jgi:hypothetical protein
VKSGEYLREWEEEKRRSKRIEGGVYRGRREAVRQSERERGYQTRTVGNTRLTSRA